MFQKKKETKPNVQEFPFKDRHVKTKASLHHKLCGHVKGYSWSNLWAGFDSQTILYMMLGLTFVPVQGISIGISLRNDCLCFYVFWKDF